MLVISLPQAHYRLGSSLAGVKRFEDAMDSFTTALELAETDEEKYDTLSQIITIGSEVEGTYVACISYLIFVKKSDY